MTIEQLRENKKMDFILRFQSAMYENYFGGDTFIIKNVETLQEGDEVGLKVERKKILFTAKEIEFIQRENILDDIRKDGWDITYECHEYLDGLPFGQWLFRAVQK